MLCRYPFLAIAVILLGGVTARRAVAADTIIIVTTTADLGGSCPGANCTLRAAIAYANASPTQDQIIGFNIPGTCPQTIQVFSELPTIGDSLSIRGYTQTGGSPNTNAEGDNATICIELQPASGGSNISNGLRFAPADITDTFDVSGLSIGGFDHGARIEGGNYTISGNFIGLRANGTTPIPNAFDGILVQASNAYFATTRQVGGSAPAQRNVISANGTGVALVSGGANRVEKNFIGTDRTGNAAAGNLTGIYASSLSNGIFFNTISGNASFGIRLENENGAANAVDINRIGLKNYLVCTPGPCPPAALALGNGADGVRIAGGAAGNDVTGNQIAWNGGAGIRLSDSGPQNNASENSMHDNAGLGIDLGVTGVNANNNDAAEPANSPNRLLNYPVLSAAGGSARGGFVFGYLQSTNSHYIIEFFADDISDPSGHGEGFDYLGNVEVDITNAPAGGNGQVTFAAPISAGSSLVGRHISAIARDTFSNTSEFSANTVYVFIDSIFANGFDPFAP